MSSQNSSSSPSRAKIVYPPRFALLDLSLELQLKIFAACDRQTLGRVCRTGKNVSALATPILWRDIDFVALREEGELAGDELIIAQGAFFFACNSIMDNDPVRWKEIAALVRVLRMVSVPSFAIPSFVGAEPPEKKSYGWAQPWYLAWIYTIDADSKQRSIFDVIFDLENLEMLHFYIKESFDVDMLSNHKKVAKKFGGRLTKLRGVHMGGNVPTPIVNAVLSHPESVEELTCLAVMDGQQDQEYHSRASIFLSDLADRFVRLKRLHLGKLAPPRDDMEHTGMRWAWDLENDMDVLDDWAQLLTHTSSTLEEVTFEDVYLTNQSIDIVRVETDRVLADEDDTTRDSYGWAASRRFRSAILPVLTERQWPELTNLTFKGIHIGQKTFDDVMGPHVTVRVQSGRSTGFNDDTTPVNISPPPGKFYYDNVDSEEDQESGTDAPDSADDDEDDAGEVSGNEG